ncbi:protein swallow [Drosophila obscura]|uniref:protein swallow n=1 Tax=Drosophila obscura TaxID=7282 RepID=UPI001BB23A2B|nr:protein swallow [Drosophila obscura]
MSLEDESFPADELFEHLNCVGTGAPRQFKSQFDEHDQPEAFERNPAPFLTSDCSDESSFIDAVNKSAKTCVSDPVGRDQGEEEVDKDFAESALANGNSKVQMGSSRNSKSVSYQDIHSAHTKRRYQHVTSKVAKYIADIQAEDQQRRNAIKKFQRHSSMPEYLTPTSSARGAHFSVDELHNLDESLDNSSAGNMTDSKTPNDSYERLTEMERLQNDKEDLKVVKERLEDEKLQLQSYNDFLQTKLDDKAMENLQLRRNIDALRIDLTDCQEKLKRNQHYSLRPPNFCPHASVPKATQTDQELLSFALADSATPLPDSNPKNLTYDSSAGSIEVALLSVAPAARKPNPGKPKKNIQPLSLDFSNDSTEAEPNGNVGASTGHSSSRAVTSRLAAAPNNSESSHPSSNDSAIEVEALDLRSPYHRQPQGSIYPPMQDWVHSDGIYYFDNRNNRVIEVRSINISQNMSSNPDESGTSERNLLDQSHVQLRHKRTSMGSRILRLFGPCVRCTDANQSVNASSATYTIGLPLLREEYSGRHTHAER